MSSVADEAESLGPGLPSLRPEIVEAAKGAFDSGLWDDAIFSAFRLVEARIQDRIGNQSIGDQLMEEAFGGSSPRILLSKQRRDQERLISLFGGSIGFFKGDRSHGATPEVPCPSAEVCARILTLASTLLDLLDLDLGLAPTIEAFRQDQADVLELAVSRVTGAPRVLVDGQVVQVVSRTNRTLAVRWEAATPGVHQVVVEDSGRRSQPFEVALWSEQPPENWHRVAAVDVPLYSDPELKELRAEKAVAIESHEGERVFRRVFPTRRSFNVGSYVSWEWDLAATVGQSWVRSAEGSWLAFSSSGFFAGNETAPLHEPRLVRIETRPREVLLRPNTRSPLLVVGYHSDGVGLWRRVENQGATLAVDDEDIAFVRREGAVYGKKGGQTRLTAQVGSTFASSEIRVASYPQFQVTEYLGGIQNPVGLAVAKHGFVITNQSEYIRGIAQAGHLVDLARVEIPMAGPGLDVIAVDGDDNIYVRTLWDRAVLRLDADKKYESSQRISLQERAHVPSALACGPDGRLYVGTSEGEIWSWRMSDPEPRLFMAVPAKVITHLQVVEDKLWVLGRRYEPDRKVLFHVDLGSTTVMGERDVTDLVPGASSFFTDGETFLFVDFYAGRIVRLNSKGEADVSIDGFRNPTAVVVVDGDIFVANFGGDWISRLFS